MKTNQKKREKENRIQMKMEINAKYRCLKI